MGDHKVWGPVRSEQGFGGGTFYSSFAKIIWVAVKELNLSYYIGETLLFIMYTHYGNLI